jgi:hypothetical protein
LTASVRWSMMQILLQSMPLVRRKATHIDFWHSEAPFKYFLSYQAPFLRASSTNRFYPAGSLPFIFSHLRSPNFSAEFPYSTKRFSP